MVTTVVFILNKICFVERAVVNIHNFVNILNLHYISVSVFVYILICVGY